MGIGRRKTSTGNLGKWVWDARAGKSYTEDRVYSERDGWNSEQHPIENDKFRAAFDMANLQVGWIAYLKGEGLNAKLVPVGEDYGDPPSDKYKEGLRLLMKMDASLGGEVRKSVSTWLMVWAAIDALHDEYLAGVANHAGKLPVVDIADTHEETTKAGTFLTPVFKIVGWLPRPPELPASGIPLVRRVKKDKADNNGGDNYVRPQSTDMDDEIPFQLRGRERERPRQAALSPPSVLFRPAPGPTQ